MPLLPIIRFLSTVLDFFDSLLHFCDTVVFSPNIPCRRLALFGSVDLAIVVLLVVLRIVLSRQVMGRIVGVKQFFGTRLDVLVPNIPVFLMDSFIRNNTHAIVVPRVSRPLVRQISVNVTLSIVHVLVLLVLFGLVLDIVGIDFLAIGRIVVLLFL
jgi:hypothetical protein